MAYMSQEKKKAIAKDVKPILKKYGLKGSLSVNNHSTLVLTVRSGKIDFIKNWNETVEPKHRGPWEFKPAEKYISVNVYHFKEAFTGKALACISELMLALNNGNWDKSDIQTDYFNVGWYVDINIGKWNKPYQLVH